MDNDIIFMNEALRLAKKAYSQKEVPVGCVIVHQGNIIARSYNQRHTKKNALHHAELISIQRACKKLNQWMLDECEMYVTLEPCLMCAGAILQSRIKRLVYATSEPKLGSCGSVINVIEDKTFHHQVLLTRGVLEEASKSLLKSFFQELRASKQKEGVNYEGNYKKSE